MWQSSFLSLLDKKDSPQISRGKHEKWTRLCYCLWTLSRIIHWGKFIKGVRLHRCLCIETREVVQALVMMPDLRDIKDSWRGQLDRSVAGERGCVLWKLLCAVLFVLCGVRKTMSSSYWWRSAPLSANLGLCLLKILNEPVQLQSSAR